MVAHTCNLATWRAVAGLLELRVQGQLDPTYQKEEKERAKREGAEGKKKRKEG